MSQPAFITPEAAIAWMVKRLEDQGEMYIDNERFAYLDDAESVSNYEHQASTGCCGCFDTEVRVADRPARVGCNYGH